MPCLGFANRCASSETHHPDREAWWWSSAADTGRIVGCSEWNQCSKTRVNPGGKPDALGDTCDPGDDLFSGTATQARSQSYTRSAYKQCWSPGVAKLRSQSSYGWTQKRLFAPNLHETILSLSSLSKSNGKALHWLTETHPDRLMACENLRKMHQLSRVVRSSELNWELIFSSKSVTEFELRYEMGCRLQFKCESKEVEFTFILKKFVWLFLTKCNSQVPKVKLNYLHRENNFFLTIIII